MSLTFTITPKGENAMLFAAIAAGADVVQGDNQRQALDFDPGAAHQQIFRFHIPGVAGQYIIRDSQTGRHILIAYRYVVDSLENAEALYQADCDTLVSKECELVCHGVTYKGCNVLSESIKRTSPYRGTGRLAGQVYFNAGMVFTQDNPAGL